MDSLEEIEAHIFGKKIGTLIYFKNRIYFEYNKEFKSQGLEISPLKLNTKNIKEPYTSLDSIDLYGGLAGVFFDSLPDKHGMTFIDKYFERKGLRESQITLLHKLAFIGDRGMGAIEYFPKEHDDYNDIDDVLIAKDVYEEMKRRLSNEAIISIENLMNIIDSVSPVGGVRPKMLISYNKEKNKIKFNKKQLNKGYKRALIKFDEAYQGVGSLNFTKHEYLYMQMAKECGIDTANVFLYKENDNHHLVVERFDRDKEDKKLHMCTASALMHKDIAVAQAISYEQLLQLTLKICNNQSEVEQMYRRMVFNALAYNFDDHGKNFSFLMDTQGQWSISPAYDITYSIGLAKEHLCTINGKGKNFTLEDFLVVAKKVNIKKSKAQEILKQTADILKTFEKRGYDIQIDEKTVKECKENIDKQLKLLEFY